MRLQVQLAALLLCTPALATQPKSERKVDIWTPTRDAIAQLPYIFSFKREPELDIFAARDLEDTLYLPVRDLPPSVLRSEPPRDYRREEELDEVVYRSPEEREAREFAEFVDRALNRA